MVFQAYMDDSYTGGGEYVLAGHIATADNWAKFARKWEELLPAATIAKSGKYAFKMAQMAALEERMERVPAFWWVIEDHVAMSLSCRINMADLKRAKHRVHVPGLAIDWGFLDNPFVVSFRALMDMFHLHRREINHIIPISERVQFFFDQQSEKGIIFRAWDDYIASRDPEIRALYGDRPKFGSDETFLPLQAADFWAWWVREWYERGTPEKIGTLEFDGWLGKARDVRGWAVDISFNEDQLVEMIIGLLRPMLEPGRPILDVRFALNGERV